MHPIYPFIRFARGCFFLYAENAISLRINKLERVITATWMKGRYVARAFFPPELRLVRGWNGAKIVFSTRFLASS